MTDDVRKSNQPLDRLTELCAEMTKVLDAPENKDVKAIVFLHTDTRGGIQISGYDDETEAMADLLFHMKKIFEVNGKTLEFIGVPDSPEGL